MRDEQEPLDCPDCPSELVERPNDFVCVKCWYVLEKSEPSPTDPADIYERRV